MRIVGSLISTLIILIFTSLVFLSYKGIETDKFNNVISEQVKKFDPNVESTLDKIKIKFDAKSLNFYLATINPQIKYKSIHIPLKEIKVFIGLKSLLGGNFTISNTLIDTSEINITQLKKIVSKSKPSNFTSFIQNNINEGFVKSKIELYFTKNFKLKNYKFDGYLKKLSGKFLDKIEITDTSFIFSINPNNGSLNDIVSNINKVQIFSGDLNYEKKENLEINLKLNTDIDLNEEIVKNNFNYNVSDLVKNFNLKAKISHTVNFTLDDTLKILNYDFTSKGNLDFLKANLEIPSVQSFLKFQISKLDIKDTNIDINFNSKKNNFIKLNGLYLFEGKNYKKYILNSTQNNKTNNINLSLDFDQEISLPLINYNKKKGIISKINSNFKIQNDKFEIISFEYNENDNLIYIKNLIFDKNKKFEEFKYVKIKTFDNKKINNEFEIYFGKNIEIKGKKFDGINLSKIKNGKSSNKLKITKDISVSIDAINTPLSKQIKQFNLIGKIINGEFVKISSKGEFEENKYLDISLKKDFNSKKKFLEIYSDVPEVMLSGFSFFEGLKGGNLLYTSAIDNNKSFSKLIVENFNVQNAPGIAKLLSLADFRGMLDLLSGKGLSFDKLEIKYIKDNNGIKLEELYALGPSISILMDGYTESQTGLVSLRGTMIPAKTLNKFLSKIPVVGDILIPKEIGEGLFGVSFKIKGYPGKMKTSVNPIKTLTPRFIQKALEKKSN